MSKGKTVKLAFHAVVANYCGNLAMSSIILNVATCLVIGSMSRKVLKFRCPKWPRMSHLDIYSPIYGQKKG